MQFDRQALVLSVCAMVMAPFALGQPEPSAVLSSVSASVMVNQGERDIPATQGMALRPGDRVMTLLGGAAEITYDNDCVQNLEANVLIIVDRGETCKAALLAQSSSATSGAKEAAALLLFGGATALLLESGDDRDISR